MRSLVSINSAICRLGRSKILQIDKFEVQEGEHWCVFGVNGSGKSVLADLLASRRAESGSYVVYSAGFDPSRDIHFVSFSLLALSVQRKLDASITSEGVATT